MPDLLESIREQLRARLDDLRPLVHEYQRLQDAEQALGDGPRMSAKPAVGPKRAEPPRTWRARAASRRRSSAPPGEANRQKILDLIGQRPGITRAELKDAASLSSAGPRRMLDRGEIREEPLPGETTGYRIANGQKPANLSRPGRRDAAPARRDPPGRGPSGQTTERRTLPRAQDSRIQASRARERGVPY